MKKNHYRWMIPLTSAALFGTAVSAEQDKYSYLNSTNRVTLSLRFGLNIKTKFSGIGSSFTSGSIFGNNKTTPDGDPYNYDNGYVGGVNGLRPDISGNFLGQTAYWGYDNVSQLGPAGGPYQTVSFNRTTATASSSDVSSGGDKPYPGFELSYDRELLEKENWRDLRFGLEAALNYVNISMNSSSASSAAVTTETDVYQISGVPSPLPPGQYGHFAGDPLRPTLQMPGLITPGVPSSATILTQDHFDADLWGGRIGPYVELPLSEKLDLRLSGGLSIGLLDANESWQQTLTPLPGGGSATASGGGDAFETLWGYYASVDATWQINHRWAVDGALQFQDLGKFTHSFQGRQVELDLSRSLFVELGISYSF